MSKQRIGIGFIGGGFITRFIGYAAQGVPISERGVAQRRPVTPGLINSGTPPPISAACALFASMVRTAESTRWALSSARSIVGLLLDHNASTDSTDALAILCSCRPSIYTLTMKLNEVIGQLLLPHGPSDRRTNPDGRPGGPNPLEEAAKAGNTEAMALLVKYGARVDTDALSILMGNPGLDDLNDRWGIRDAQRDLIKAGARLTRHAATDGVHPLGMAQV